MGEGVDRFIRVADGVESAKSVREGPYLHVYHGRLAGVEGSVRLLALAPGVDDDDVRTAFVETVQDWQTASTHPNVATVRARGTEPRPWVAAELVEADSESVADAQSGLSPADCSHLVDDIAEALRVAGLYNARPPALTPETVRVRRTAEGVRAVVADWGLERVCRVAAGESLDSPFVPPERLDGAPRTERASVYEFGALAHYLLTGRPPADPGREGNEDRVTIPDDEGFDQRLDDTLRQALATDPAERHDSAHTLRSNLVATLPDPGPRDSSPPGDVGSTVDNGPAADDNEAAVDNGEASSGGTPGLDLALGDRWTRRRAGFTGVALLVVVLAAGVALGPGLPSGGDSGGELAVEIQEGETLDLDAGGQLVFELAGGDGEHAVVLEPGTAAGEEVSLSPETAGETPGVEYDDGTWRIDAGAFAALTGAQPDGEEAGTYSITPQAEGFETVPAEVSLLSGAADPSFEVALDGVDGSVAGERLGVTVTVENTGDGAGEGVVTLDVGDLGAESVEVALDAGESTIETLTVDTATGDAGEYTATVATDDDEVTASVEVTAATATFTVDIAGTNSPIVAGEELGVTATVENTGNGAGEGSSHSTCPASTPKASRSASTPARRPR